MTEKLSERLWRLLNDASERGVLNSNELCLLDEARNVVKRWEDAPVVDVTDCNNPKRQLPNSPMGITWDDFPTIKCRLVPEVADRTGMGDG